METAMRIISDLREQGFLVRIRQDGKVGISPADRLTPEVREIVIANREDIFAVLQREADEMNQETRKVARIFEGAYVPRGVDLAVALIGARIMASGCPLGITTSDGKHFPILNLDDYRAYVDYSEKTWGKKKVIPLKLATTGTFRTK